MSTPRKLTDNFIATLVDEEVVLIDMAGGELLSLKDTGRAIWDLIDGMRSQEAIVDELVARYDVAADTASADVAELLEDLASAGLVDG